MSNGDGSGEWETRFRTAIGNMLGARNSVLDCLEEYEGRGAAAWLKANNTDPGTIAAYVTAQYTLGQIEAAFKQDSAFIPNLYRARSGEPPIGYVASEEPQP